MSSHIKYARSVYWSRFSLGKMLCNAGACVVCTILMNIVYFIIRTVNITGPTIIINITITISVKKGDFC